MHIDHLKYFIALAKDLSFSVASDNLCISQSSLSKQIKALENELGVLLFLRNNRKVSLTPAGLAFSVHANQIMEEYNQMLASIKDFSPQWKHSISITCIPVMSAYGIMEMIDSFTNKYSNIPIHVVEAEMVSVLRSLDRFATDLAIMRTNRLSSNDYQIFPLINDELVLVTNGKHPFARKGCISLSEAANEVFFFLNSNTGMYDSCLIECAKAGFSPKLPNISSNKLLTVARLVSRDKGVAMLMKKIAEDVILPGMSIVRLKEKPIYSLSVVARRETLSSVCTDFIKFAVNYFKHERIAK